MYTRVNKYRTNIYSLIQNISWQQLPWQSIKMRVLMLTKQIYLATKKNDLVRIYYLQNYLVSCIEIKILLIKKVLDNYQYNNNELGKIYNSIKRVNKFQLLMCLHFNHIIKDKLSCSIAKKIKHDIIYILTEPIWKARCSQRLIKLVDNSIIFQKFYTFDDINNKYLLIKIIIKKLSCYNYLNRIAQQVIFVDLFYLITEKLIYKLNNKISSSSFLKINCRSLSSLLNHIVLNNTHWSIFNDIKKNVCIHFNRQLLNINNINTSFLILMRNNLYRKTIKSFNIINIFGHSKNILNKIKILYKYQYYNLEKIIKVDIQEYYNELINIYVNVWLKKHVKNDFIISNHFYNIHLANNEINHLTYVSNIFKNYAGKHI